MEEILASIRNIIAQDPSTEISADDDRVSASAPSRPVTARSSASSFGGAGEADRSGFGSKPNIDLRSTPAAGLLPPEPGPDHRVASAVSASAIPEGRGAPAAGSTHAAGSPVADDFSDVFEEPLQQVSIAPVRAEFPPPNSTESDAGRIEPQLPRGGNGLDQSAHSVGPVNAEPKRTSTLPDAGPPAPRGDFDFGTLRAPRVEDSKPSLANTGLFGREKPAPAPAPAAQDEQKPSNGLAERPSEPVTLSVAGEDKSGEPPRQKVVIAAMPAAGDAGVAVKPAKFETDPEPEVANTGADGPEKSEFAKSVGGKTGFRTANVGFPAGSSPQDQATDGQKTIFPKPSEVQLANEVKSEVAIVGPEPAGLEANLDESASGFGTPGVPKTDEIASGEAESASEDIGAPAAASPQASPVAAAASRNLMHGLSAANVVVSGNGDTVRTLEDTVSELLRPLLREWLENNMPRIVEKALRLEMADSVKKQLAGSADKPNGLGK